MRKVHINQFIKEIFTVDGEKIKLFDFKSQCALCFVNMTFTRNKDNKDYIDVGECACIAPSQGTIAERTKYKVFLNGTNVSEELQLRNGKANPFGWSQYEVWHNNERVGFLESGTLDIDKKYLVKEEN